MPRERRELAARSEGKKLYLVTESGWEDAYDWDGPPGAHRAVIDEQRNNHPFGSELIMEISVYDVDGKYIGGISKQEWS